MGISQLNTPILVTSPLGEATCHFVQDGGDETYWGVFQKDTCELWWWRGNQIRYAIHLSEGFVSQSPIKLSQEAEKALAWHRTRYPAPVSIEAEHIIRLPDDSELPTAEDVRGILRS